MMLTCNVITTPGKECSQGHPFVGTLHIFIILRTEKNVELIIEMRKENDL
jgi:hypothetical protein